MNQASTRRGGPNGGTPTGPLAGRRRALFLRLTALAVLVAVYVLIDWSRLQSALRWVMSGVLDLIGKPGSTAEICASPCLLLPGGRLYTFAANCVYINLFLVTAPFAWRFGRPRGRNLFRLFLLAAGLLAINVVRLTTAFVFHGQGASWTWIHDVPDALIRLTFIALFVAAAMKADFRSAAGVTETPDRLPIFDNPASGG